MSLDNDIARDNQVHVWIKLAVPLGVAAPSFHAISTLIVLQYVTEHFKNSWVTAISTDRRNSESEYLYIKSSIIDNKQLNLYLRSYLLQIYHGITYNSYNMHAHKWHC